MYVTPKRCPRCRYERQRTDTAPDWQCPSCGVAYNKAEAAPLPRPGPTRVEKSAGGAIWKLGLFVLATLLLAYGMYTFQQSRLPRKPVATANGAQPEVVMYSTSWCGYCAKARAFFAQHKIDYLELDVEKDQEAAQINRRLGGGGVPTIMVGDTVINGFNEQALADSLEPWLK
jgi:glutaredoxin